MLLSSKRELITNEELDNVFENTNFGDSKPSNIVKWSLLKIASGYAAGYTAKVILQSLSLLSRSKYPKLTKRGQYCLWEFFKDGYKHE